MSGPLLELIHVARGHCHLYRTLYPDAFHTPAGLRGELTGFVTVAELSTLGLCLPSVTEGMCIAQLRPYDKSLILLKAAVYTWEGSRLL